MSCCTRMLRRLDVYLKRALREQRRHWRDSAW